VDDVSIERSEVLRFCESTICSVDRWIEQRRCGLPLQKDRV